MTQPDSKPPVMTTARVALIRRNVCVITLTITGCLFVFPGLLIALSGHNRLERFGWVCGACLLIWVALVARADRALRRIGYPGTWPRRQPRVQPRPASQRGRCTITADGERLEPALEQELAQDADIAAGSLFVALLLFGIAAWLNLNWLAAVGLVLLGAFIWEVGCIFGILLMLLREQDPVVVELKVLGVIPLRYKN